MLAVFLAWILLAHCSGLESGAVVLVCLLHACFLQLSGGQIGFPRGVVCFPMHIEAGDGFVGSPFLDLLCRTKVLLSKTASKQTVCCRRDPQNTYFMLTVFCSRGLE